MLTRSSCQKVDLAQEHNVCRGLDRQDFAAFSPLPHQINANDYIAASLSLSMGRYLGDLEDDLIDSSSIIRRLPL